MRSLWVWLVVPVMLLVTAGCSHRQEESSSVKQPNQGAATPAASPHKGAERDAGGHLSVTIQPAAPTVEDTLVALVRGGTGDLDYRWEQDGEILPGQVADHLPAHNARKGDQITVVVTGPAGSGEASVSLVNSPPRVLAVPFKDPYIQHGVDIEVSPEVADADGDPVDFHYRWVINGEQLEDFDESILPGDRFQRGDRIALQVIPHDSEEEGPAYTGREFVVPDAPPVFVSEPLQQFQAELYVYDARAEDPDGDELVYSLESCPEGMTIDSRTGHIEWKIEQGQTGKHTVRIVATDPEGKTAVQEYTLTIAITE